MESGGGDTGGIFQIKKGTDFAGAPDFLEMGI